MGLSMLVNKKNRSLLGQSKLTFLIQDKRHILTGTVYINVLEEGWVEFSPGFERNNVIQIAKEWSCCESAVHVFSGS